MKPEALHQQKAKQQMTVVDVRSPKEFQTSTIPGSINIPVFTDEERAEVGTTYKQIGPEAANEKGLTIFSKKLPAFIAAFQEINTPITVFCWRGGMRSKTAATVVDLMGIPIHRLSGGFRAYREWTLSQLQTLDFCPKLIVLNGHTGNGKTLILEHLYKEGYPVINLEQMAGHRGSIFGQIGRSPNNQRTFDFLLLEQLLNYQDKPYILIEGESKRIGKVTLPDKFYQKKENSRQLILELPMEKRIANLLEDYEPWKDPDQFITAFRYIKRRMHTPIAKEIEQALHTGDFAKVVELLLIHYYDPRYNHATAYPDKQQTHITATSIEEALEKIKQAI